jgi:hypothetical protein
MQGLRSLMGLRYEILNSVNQKLWPTKTLESGLIIDTRLSDEIINIVLQFFEEENTDFWSEQFEFVDAIRVDAILNSLISDSILRIETTDLEWDLPWRFWLEICNENGSWTVLRAAALFWWSEEAWKTQFM